MMDARISTSFPQHHKTKKLSRRLGPAGPLACLYLFLWAAANRTDGDLSGMTDEDIELAIDWTGNDGDFVEAMTEVGFLDGDEQSRVIHDWAEHNPWAAGAEDRSKSSSWAALCKRYGRDGAAERMPEYASRMRVASETHAKRKEAQCEPDAPLPSPSPSPSPSPKQEQKKELPPSAAEDPVKLMIDAGIAYLGECGVAEKQARSLIGMTRKAAGDLRTCELLATMEQQRIASPAAWLRKASERQAEPVRQTSSYQPVPGEIL